MEPPTLGGGGRPSESLLGSEPRSPQSALFSPTMRPAPLRFGGEMPTSPTKSKARGVRIAMGAEELPNTQGNVARLDLPTLARKLHVPVSMLSKSLGGAQPNGFDDEVGSVRSRGLSIPISPKGSPRASPSRPINSSINSISWFPGGSRSDSVPPIEPYSSPYPSTHLSPDLYTHPSVRIRYMSAAPQQVINVHCPSGAELGVRWESAAGGLLAAKVHQNSVAAATGFVEGMRLLQVNGVNVFTKTEYLAEMNKPRDDPLLKLTVQSNSHIGSIYTGSPPVSPKMYAKPHDSVSTMGLNEDPVTPLYEDLDDMYFRYTPGDGPAASPGFHPTDDPADVEVEVHENGLARLVAGRADSAYIVSDPHSKGAVFAVSDQEGFESPAGKRTRSIFGSFIHQMSGVLGFGGEVMRSPSQDHLPMEKARHVAFADDAGAELVSSVRVYEEIDTVLLELKFVFPKWVWVVLALMLCSFTVTRPLMFSAYEHELSAHMVIATQTVMEFGLTLLLAVVSYPLIRSENLSFLWIDKGWAIVVVCGLSHTLAKVSFMTSLTQYNECGGKACPPVLFECVTSILLIIYYTLTRFLERRRVGQADEAWFPLELGGMLLTMGGAGVVLSQQVDGIQFGPSAYAVLGAAGMAGDMIMRRRVASQMPVPVALFLMHCISLVFSLVFVLALHKIDDDDMHHVKDNMPKLASAAGTGFLGSLTTLLVLRHMHPYPVVAVITFAFILQVLLSSAVFDTRWDDASTVALPAVFTSLIGTLLTTWANVRHRSIIEVEIVQAKRLNRRKATGHKGPGRSRNRSRAPSRTKREIIF